MPPCEDELFKLIQEWRDAQLANIDWRKRYYKLRDEADELELSNQALRARLDRPATEEIERLKSEIAALESKCAVLMDSLDAAKLRRKSSLNLF